MFVASLFSCGGNSISDAVVRQMTQFPKSTLQDLYKSFFQDRFGPGHIIADETSAMRYLQYELATMDTPIGPLLEPTGYCNRYTRVSLQVIKDSLVSVEQFFDVFMRSARMADTVVVESNYDMDMLMSGPYTYELKMRIVQGCGHLSNDECASAIRRFVHPELRNIFLCHLSENNNTPDLAYKASVEALEASGYPKGSIALRCLPRQHPSPMFEL